MSPEQFEAAYERVIALRDLVKAKRANVGERRKRKDGWYVKQAGGWVREKNAALEAEPEGPRFTAEQHEHAKHALWEHKRSIEGARVGRSRASVAGNRALTTVEDAVLAELKIALDEGEHDLTKLERRAARAGDAALARHQEQTPGSDLPQAVKEQFGARGLSPGGYIARSSMSQVKHHAEQSVFDISHRASKRAADLRARIAQLDQARPHLASHAQVDALERHRATFEAEADAHDRVYRAVALGDHSGEARKDAAEKGQASKAAQREADQLFAYAAPGIAEQKRKDAAKQAKKERAQQRKAKEAERKAKADAEADRLRRMGEDLTKPLPDGHHRIATRGGVRAVATSARAGLYAAHEDDGQAIVTHVPSGQQVVRVPASRAEEAVRHFDEHAGDAGADWSFGEVKPKAKGMDRLSHAYSKWTGRT